MSVFCVVRIKNDLFDTEATPKKGGLSVLYLGIAGVLCSHQVIFRQNRWDHPENCRLTKNHRDVPA